MAFPEHPPRLKLGLRYEERKKDPPPGLEWHKVDPPVDGHTLATLAANYGVRWVDIALYNFRTEDLGEINWYLHHYVGCKHKAGSWYTFKGGERLLVPRRPPKRVKASRRMIDAARDADNKHDMQVHVQVVERTAAGSSSTVVSGKWLYVFSASDGVDFGHDPSRGPGFGKLKEFGVLGPQLPETAFKLSFPGVFPIRNKPVKLECEIYVTAEDPASDALIKEFSAHATGSEKTPRYKIGNHWHFITGARVTFDAPGR